MKRMLVLLAAVALIGSAAAWDISENLQYTYTKSGFEQAGYTDVLPQVIGTTSGAYATQPTAYGDGWLQMDNTLIGATIDRTNDGNLANPEYSAEGNNFYTQLTQGGEANLAISARDTIATDPEVVGDASAYQNLWVGGEFAKTKASFDSRAIVGFSDIPGSDYNGVENANHFVATDVVSATSSVDSDTYGSGYFNTANMGVKVDADIQQNYVGSGWAEPTYSGGITMWANFDGACDPHCANPIKTTVSGSAFTSIFPANGAELVTNSQYGAGSVGDIAYWGTAFETNPQVTSTYGGTPNPKW
jgi:hypothetical protein